MAQRGVSDGSSLTVHSPGFVGRERELAALADALAGPPSLVLVEGETGIGKSRLVAEFLAGEPGRRLEPLVAACPPFRQPYTLGPVVDGVRRSAAGRVPGLRLSGLAGALRSLFPEWAVDLPPAPEPLPDASASRHRLFRALAELVSCLGTRLLVVEDVHWADDATLEFLLFLAAQQPRQVSLLLTFRADEVPPDSLLPRLSSRPGAPGVRRLPLAPLSVPETAKLISSMLDGERVHPDFAGFLHRHTEGVPLAVEESVRLLADRADLVRRGGVWVRRRSEKITVPPTVRDAVLERAGRLGADAQAVLRAAAVLAEAADEAVLAAVAGIPAERAVVALVTSLDCGLLGEEAGGGGFCFRHVLAAQVVHEAIPAPLRSRMHLRAAQALEALPRPPAVRLARHFRAAGQVDAWRRYAEQAADLAAASGDAQTAVALLGEVVTAGGLPPGEVARLAGKIEDSAAAAEDMRGNLAAMLRAVLTADTAGPQERGLIHYQLSRILNGMGDRHSARQHLEQAVGLLPEHSREAAQAMLLLARPDGDLSAPKSVHLAWLNRATAAGTAIPEDERLVFAVDVATALLCLDEECWDKVAAICAVAPSARHLVTITRAGMNFGHHATRWGRYGEARQHLERSLGLAAAHEFPTMLAATQANLAYLRWFTGEWEGLAGEAAALLAREDLLLPFRREAMLVTGLLRFAAGDTHAGACLEQVLATARSGGGTDTHLEAAAALARLRLASGDAELAVALTDELAGVVMGKDIWVWAADLVPVRTAALTAAGHLAEADGLVAAYAAGLAGHSGLVARTHLLESRAILAGARDEHDEAAALWASAADEWRELPRPYDALRAGEQRALALLAMVRGDSVAGSGSAARDEALDLLSGVLRGFEQLGAAGDTARVARCLRDHGVSVATVWRGGRHGYGTELSPRELDVVRLVATGQSNRQIAAQVHRSPATIAAQLQSAMRKLGVSSRTALAVRAAEAGIIPSAGE